jgi:hypothetical protein
MDRAISRNDMDELAESLIRTESAKKYKKIIDDVRSRVGNKTKKEVDTEVRNKFNRNKEEIYKSNSVEAVTNKVRTAR